MTEPYGYGNYTANLMDGVASVTHAQTLSPTTATTPKSTPVNVNDTGKAYIQVKFTGAAGGTGLVTFNFVARGHPSHSYPTEVMFSRAIAQAGAVAKSAAFEVDTSVLYDIALLSVQNADAAADITGVQAIVSYKL